PGLRRLRQGRREEVRARPARADRLARRDDTPTAGAGGGRMSRPRRSAKPHEPLPRPVQHRAERVRAQVVMDWKPTPRAHDGALGELVLLSPRLDAQRTT